MANCIFGFPNYVDVTKVYSVVITGGSWLTPLTNLLDRRLSKYAKSDGFSESNTWFEVDLGTNRVISLAAIPSTNGSLESEYEFDVTDTPAFSLDTVVGSSASLGATSVTFKAPASSDITITSGDFFTIGGYLYKSDTTLTITGGNTGSISLAAKGSNDVHNAILQAAISVDDSIVCNTGDYTTTKYSSSRKDIFQRIYPWGSLPWQHPSWWNGKATEEQRQQGKFPIVEIMTDTVVLGRYARYKFYDSTNTSDGFKVSRLFLTPGWQTSINPIYGAGIQYVDETSVTKSYGLEESFSIKSKYRTMAFTIEHLPENEALSQALELQKEQGIHSQMFFVFDPEDTEKMHVRAFPARLDGLDPLTYDYFERMSFAGVLKEPAGGLLT